MRHHKISERLVYSDLFDGLLFALRFEPENGTGGTGFLFTTSISFCDWSRLVMNEEFWSCISGAPLVLIPAFILT